jgi:hypothetical protein
MLMRSLCLSLQLRHCMPPVYTSFRFESFASHGQFIHINEPYVFPKTKEIKTTYGILLNNDMYNARCLDICVVK